MSYSNTLKPWKPNHATVNILGNTVQRPVEITVLNVLAINIDIVKAVSLTDNIIFRLIGEV